MICPVEFTHELSVLRKRRGKLEGGNPQQYFAAETERMMKLRDVPLKAMAKKITQWEAAEIIGVAAQAGRAGITRQTRARNDACAESM